MRDQLFPVDSDPGRGIFAFSAGPSGRDSLLCFPQTRSLPFYML